MSSSSSRRSPFRSLLAGEIAPSAEQASDRASEPSPGHLTADDFKRKCTVELKAQALGPLRSAVESAAASVRLLDAARSAVQQVAFENCEAAASVPADVAAAAENLAWNSGGNPPSNRHELKKHGSPSTESRLLS
jgi:hypothetical protein